MGKIIYRIYLSIEKIIGLAYSPVIAILMTGLFAWEEFVKSSSLFFSTLFGDDPLSKYSPDFLVVAVWISAFAMSIISFLYTLRKERKVKKELDRIFSKTPSISLLQRAALLFDNTYQELLLIEQLMTALQNKDENKKEDIERFFRILLRSTIKPLAQEFLELNNKKIGLNIMLYFDRNELIIAGRNTFDYCLSKDSVYLVEGKNNDIEGILHLCPALNDPIIPELVTKSLTIPVYKPEAHIYTSLNHPGKRVAIPGAPTALFEDTHFILNTEDPVSYSFLNEQTRDQVLGYFRKYPNSTKAILSYKFPVTKGACFGVLNIELPCILSFSTEYLTSFYSVLTPTLILVNKYLGIYKSYLIPNLTSPVNKI